MSEIHTTAHISDKPGVKFKPPALDVSEVEPEFDSDDQPGTSAGKRESLKTPPTPGGLTGRMDSVASEKKKIRHRRVDKETGEVTYKKVPTFTIMGAIQLGIANSLGKNRSRRDLLHKDFKLVESQYFPSSALPQPDTTIRHSNFFIDKDDVAVEGSDKTPSHGYDDFRFKTYAPVAFQYFRTLFGIRPDDFLASLCSEALRELSNPGASGSIFYLTNDDQFILKTVMHKEAEFLQKLLAGYYMNLDQNPHTLLPKFFGLYCFQNLGKNIRLLIMNNLLPSTIKLHQKYDLKGSTYKRRASRREREKSSPTLKDLDFLEDHPDGIFLEAETYDALSKTIGRDCLVLESFKIMDYSMLVGIHNIDQAQREKHEALLASPTSDDQRDSGENNGSLVTRPGTLLDRQVSEDGPTEASVVSNSFKPEPNQRRIQRHKSLFSNALEDIQADVIPVDNLGEGYPQGGIPARNARGERLLLFIGVIDILQSYRAFKKFEHTWKSIWHDGDTISVHRPRFYAQRFEDFMKQRVFKKIQSLDQESLKGGHRKFRTFVASYLALKHSPSKKKRSDRRSGGDSSRRPVSGSEQTAGGPQPALSSGKPDLVQPSSQIDERPGTSTGIDRSEPRRGSGGRSRVAFESGKVLMRQDVVYDDNGPRESARESKKIERLFATEKSSSRDDERRGSSGDSGGEFDAQGGASRPVLVTHL